MTTANIMEVAVHEAGHAVAARACGVEVRCLSISSAGANYSGEILMRGESGGLPYFHSRDMIISAAGPEAFAMYTGREDPGQSGDLKQLRNAAIKLVGLDSGEAKIERRIKQARARARKLLRHHWNDVMRLARWLNDFYQQVEQVVPAYVFDLSKLDKPRRRAAKGNRHEFT